MKTKAMDPWERAEAKRLAARKRLAIKLGERLGAARAKYAARGIALKVVVDNDSWHLTTTRDADWTEAIGDDLRRVRTKDLDVGPQELACLLAIALGFDAGLP